MLNINHSRWETIFAKVNNHRNPKRVSHYRVKPIHSQCRENTSEFKTKKYEKKANKATFNGINLYHECGVECRLLFMIYVDLTSPKK